MMGVGGGRMIRIISCVIQKTDGAVAIEYAMICAMIILVIIGAIGALGSGVANTLYSQIAAAM